MDVWKKAAAGDQEDQEAWWFEVPDFQVVPFISLYANLVYSTATNTLDIAKNTNAGILRIAADESSGC